VNDIPLGLLFGILALLIILSGFFSGSETALMTINRYRLRHMAKKGHKGALRVDALLQRPDRLIGLILLGNNFVNILASMLTTLIALRQWGESSIAIAAGLLTLVVLIFAEVAPKTLAALHPERIAFIAAYIYTPLMRIARPLVWVVNTLANGLLKLIGIQTDKNRNENLSREELRTVVNEAGSLIPKRHRAMLLNILDMENITVNDVMVPRNEILGIDLDDSWDEILNQVSNSPRSRLLVYRENLEGVVGFLNLRKLGGLHLRNEITRETLESRIRDPFYIPEETPLTQQLIAFQQNKRRIGLVVDEYGDILGLVTLEDILEEIVGKFTTDRQTISPHLHPQGDGSYIADGGTPLREINRQLNWSLPTDGPKTLNGLLLEELEIIPQTGTTLLLESHPVEIIQTKGNVVRSVRIHPKIKSKQPLNKNAA